MESKPTNKRSRKANKLVTILKNSYEKLPTVAAGPKTTAITFSDMISVATPIVENHRIIKNELVRMHTAYKNTRGKVRSIYPSLVWHDTEKKKKDRYCKEKFKRKSFLSALPGITAQKCTTTIDPISKTVYGKIKIGIANNIYDKLSNDDDTTAGVYKTSWLLDTAASDMYADTKTVVRDPEKIPLGSGVDVGCANNGIMNQTGKGKLPFDNLPEGTRNVKIFNDMHSPLLSGGVFVTEGDCTLVFGRENAHILKGKTGEVVKAIMKQAEKTNSDDIVMTVPFDEKTLTWKTDGTGKAKPLFNIASNVHKIRSKEVLCDYLHRAAGYPVKKTWLQAIKDGFFTTWPGLTYELVAKFLPEYSEETAAGHLHRRRQGIRSTRVPVVERLNTVEMMEPELPGQGTLKQNREQRVGVHLVAHDELIIELNGTISTDQTGRFPIMSQKGNQYMMVLYNYDSNAILAEGCKSRTATDLETAYDKLYNRLTKAGIVPVMQRIDNEVLKEC